LEKGFRLLRQAVHTHIITSKAAMPLMSEGGLIVEITDGDALHFRGTLFYDLAKTTVIRLAFAMAEELRDSGIASVAVTPGFLRSETMLELMGVTTETWRDGAAQDPHFLYSETPLFVGRGIASLAADPAKMDLSGQLFASWTLARKYGFCDGDGGQPDWGAHCDSESFSVEQKGSHARFVDGCRGSWSD
jgi:NAD(P)-dependent dehydrogenase (short-subunit alcohol dehydrogenase family)